MALELSHRRYGAGPPLVILHGLFGSAHNWQSIAQGLAAARCVYTLDLRNHGDSPWEGTMSYPEMAADVSSRSRTPDTGSTPIGPNSSRNTFSTFCGR